MANIDLVILGTFAIDNVRTPFGESIGEFGGSAPYAACAASLFSKVGILSIKGEDISDDKLKFMIDKGISLEGLQSKGKSMRWDAEYSYDMNEAKTLHFEANSLNDFRTEIPEGYKNVKNLFVANFDPEKQIEVMEKVDAEFVLLDTGFLWIDTKKEKLIDAIRLADVLILNEWEARKLFDTSNLVKASREAFKLGLKAVVIKKGEHGALLFQGKEIFSCPGYPIENAVDPTGCGDAFGGAFIGHYSKYKDMKRALVYATVIASFNAESFGLRKLKELNEKEIEERFNEMVKLTKF